MTLEEVRGRIDALDPGIRDLLMERMDLSCHVAEAKKESGDFRVYRPDREEEILKRLGQGVEEARKAEGVVIPEKAEFVRIRLTRPDRPGSMSSVLGMVGDYGFNMKSMTLLEEDPEEGKVAFELVIRGDLRQRHMQKLMFQLSMECEKFKITEVF